MNAEQKFNKIGKLILNLTDSDFDEINSIIDSQLNYCHPLKMATQGKHNKLGRQNKKVIESILKLKKILEVGKELAAGK